MPTITVHGSPAPQGSKRHIGKGVMVEMSKKVKPWREAVKHAVLCSDGFPVAGPVRIQIVFTLPKPSGAPKKVQTYPSKKPDIDKLLRSTLDGLVDCGAIDDDARVVEVTATKCFPMEGLSQLGHPGAQITVSGYPL